MNDSTWNETRKRGAVLLAALVLVFAPACLAASHEAHEGGTSHEGHGGDESHEGDAEAAQPGVVKRAPLGTRRSGAGVVVGSR